MKKLILTAITGLLISSSIFANDLDSTGSNGNSEKMNRIKYSIDSLIRSELGDVALTDLFNEDCHNYAKKFILKDEDRYNPIIAHYRTVNSVSNDVVSIYDLPVSHLVSRIKEGMAKADIKDWEFKKYSIVFGEFEGKSYMAISIDY
jgi:hypothetical protein